MAFYVLQANKKTTISGDFAAGATSLTLATAAFSNFTDGYLVADYDNDSKFEIMKCTVSGTAVTSITRGQDGTSDVAHSSGAKIGFMFVPSHWSDLSPTLGYAESISDFSTTTVNSYVDVTSLSSTVTVPTTVRRVKITAWANNIRTTGSSANILLNFAIREGSTVLAETTVSTHAAVASLRLPAITIYSNASISAGSHTYKISVKSDTAGTLTVQAGATNPAFILVEYI